MITARMHLPVGPGEDRVVALEQLLNTLAECNAAWFSENPDAPSCLACEGVRYHNPPVGKCQNFWNAPQVLRQGKASCAGAACYDAGVRLAQGQQARVAVEPIDGISLHAVVYANGERTDPSAGLRGAPHGDGTEHGYAVAGPAGVKSYAYSVGSPAEYFGGRRVSRAASRAISRARKTYRRRLRQRRV